MPVTFLLGAVCIVLAGIFLPGNRIGTLCLYGAAVCLGAWWAYRAAHPPPDRDLGRWMNREQEHLVLTGVISSDPVYHAGEDFLETAYWDFELHMERVTRTLEPQPVEGRVRCRIRDTQRTLAPAYGDRIHVEGVVRKMESTFSRKHRPPYALRGRAGQVEIESQGNGHALTAWCYRARETCLGLLSRGVETYPDAYQLVRSLLLGDRDRLPDRVKETFSRSGTLHILAISGTHVGILLILVLAGIRAAGVSRPHWVLIAGPVLLAYSIATGGSPSAMRASIMAICFLGADFLRRKPDGPSALGLAALIILGMRPLDIFNPGFQLSFAVVTGIMLAVPRLRRSLPGVEADPWQLQPETLWLRSGRSVMRWLRTLLIVSVAAWLASLPLTAVYFNLFSPVAIPGNLVVIPLAFVILLTGVLSLLTGTWFPWLGVVFNHANVVFAGLLLQFVDLLRRIPFGHLFVETPPWWVIPAWYGGVALVLFGRRLMLRTAGTLMLAALLAVPAYRMFLSPEVRVIIFGSSRTTSAVIDRPGWHDVMIDAGSYARRHDTLRLLRSFGINRVEDLYISRPVSDAIGAAPAMSIDLGIRRWHITESGGRSPTYRDKLDYAAYAGIPVLLRRPGTEYDRFGLQWDILHPAEGEYANARDSSLVLRIGFEGQSMLFCGYADAEVERDMLARGEQPAASLVVAGRMGGADAFSAPFLEASRPDHIVMPVRAGYIDGETAAPMYERMHNAGAVIMESDDACIIYSLRDGSCTWRER